MNRLHAFLASLTVSLFTSLPIADAQQKPAPVEVPKSSDPRLIVELVAAQPDIVQPINIAFDSKGRLLVIESHTHFRPPGYKGPPADRIRVIEPVPGKSKADHVGTFFEGTKHTMDIAVRFDGSIYLATRNEILRLTDTRGDGKAITKQRIAFLDTKGDYPHDGLCGLCFDSQGNLFFGLGENLGYAYKMIGSRRHHPSRQGDGGHIFYCTADGNKLRRVATGVLEPVRHLPGHLRPNVLCRQRSRLHASVPARPCGRRRRLRLPVPLRPRRPPSLPGLERRDLGMIGQNAIVFKEKRLDAGKAIRIDALPFHRFVCRSLPFASQTTLDSESR